MTTTVIEVADGETVAVDLREALFPVGWSCIRRAGTITHRAANAAQPADEDWLSPAENASITASVLVAEDVPIDWLRWAAAGGTAKVAVNASRRVVRHSSVAHSLAADASHALPAITLAIGDAVTLDAAPAFSYGGDPSALHYAVSTAAAWSLARREGSLLTLKGEAAAAAQDLTLTATAPHGATATRTVRATVT